jgi:MinD-like ATPase involved in chromosome partitioning or flagellar assembly
MKNIIDYIDYMNTDSDGYVSNVTPMKSSGGGGGIMRNILDIELNTVQKKLRSDAINNLWIDTKESLDDMLLDLDYNLIDKERVIVVNRWLPDIQEYYKSIMKGHEYKHKEQGHWVSNYEIIELIKKYAADNNMIVKIDTDVDNYIVNIS